jgi:Na+/H+ antiporter NhaD/arsenite permease-like protein
MHGNPERTALLAETATFIALLAAVPVLLLSGRRVEMVRKVDWETLVFFAAMFVLMESVWESGVLQSFIGLFGEGITAVPVVLGLSIVVSQFVSNVPWVALYLPVITEAGGSMASLMALAAGSTIAGNLSILGAASNVIIIQNAEKEGRPSPSESSSGSGSPHPRPGPRLLVLPRDQREHQTP